MSSILVHSCGRSLKAASSEHSWRSGRSLSLSSSISSNNGSPLEDVSISVLADAEVHLWVVKVDDPVVALFTRTEDIEGAESWILVLGLKVRPDQQVSATTVVAGSLPELARWTKLFKVPWVSEEDKPDAVRGAGTGEMVAIGISSSASLNQAIAEAGFRAPLVLRVQDSRLLLDMIKWGAHCGTENFTKWLVPFYTQGLSCSACTPSNKDSNHCRNSITVSAKDKIWMVQLRER